MPLAIRLAIATEDGGGWRVALGDRDTRPTEARVPAQDVAALTARVSELLAPMPAVVVPGKDAARTRAEEEAGRQLARALTASPELGSRLAFHLGFARGRGETTVLLVDAEDRGVRALPWELLASSIVAGAGPLEAAEPVVIARLAPGRARAPSAPAAAIHPLLWCPDPDDEVCAARLQRLARSFAAAGISAPRTVDPSAGAWGEPAAGSVLHVVAHGRRAGDQLEVLSESNGRASSTAGHALAPILRGVELVVLDVCEGGAATERELEGLATALVHRGAPACTAPLDRAGLEAADAFSTALYAALARSAPIAEAVARGRAAVRDLAIGHPDSRWCNFALWFGDAGTASSGGLVVPHWRPSGWPVPAPDLARLFDAAFRLSRAAGAGHVGLEHLVQALAQVPGEGMTTRHVRYVLSNRAEPWREVGPDLVPAPGGAPGEAGTPRLVAYGASFSAGVDLESFWQRVAADPEHGLHLLPGVGSLLNAPGVMATGETLEAGGGGHGEGGGVPTALQVLWGPEDGRVLFPAPGDRIGRWTQEAPTEHALYARTALTDPFLSRAHLEWLGPGRVRLKRPAALHRRGSRLELEPGEVALELGDVLALTGTTRLRAVLRAPSEPPPPSGDRGRKASSG